VESVVVALAVEAKPMSGLLVLVFVLEGNVQLEDETKENRLLEVLDFNKRGYLKLRLSENCVREGFLAGAFHLAICVQPRTRWRLQSILPCVTSLVIGSQNHLLRTRAACVDRYAGCGLALGVCVD
jgi:hypothetical protein